MRPLIASSLLLAFSISVEGSVLKVRQSDSNGTAKVSIPQKDLSPDARKNEVSYRHDNFLYNISLIGNAAAFPMGKLGEERVARAWDEWQEDRNAITIAIGQDLAEVKKAIAAVRFSDSNDKDTPRLTSSSTVANSRHSTTMSKSCTRTSG
jgi:hypothetical protein